MSKSDAPSFSAINLPSGWESKLQLVLLEPQREAPMLKTASPNVAAPPRTNVMVGREALAERSAESVIETMQKELLARFPKNKCEPIADFAFTDGTAGKLAVAEVELPQGLSMVQMFVVRADGPWVTTFVATTTARERHRLDTELKPMIASFTP